MCLKAIYDGKPFEPAALNESVVNLYERYQCLDEANQEDLRGEALQYFTDWLLENVILVEITAGNHTDAYTIFETMNHLGLSLSSAEMLKGFLLANIHDPDERKRAGTQWQRRIHELTDAGREVEQEFFKTWFRSQYAQRIPKREEDALPEDFEQISTELHR